MNTQQEQVQNQDAPSAAEAKQELQYAVDGSNEVLATATTTGSLFRDTLTLDRAKLTITKRTFFRTSDVMSMRIEDVMNAKNTLGPLLGSITIASRIMNIKNTTIGQFWRKDAVRLKRIIQGYVIAQQREIDCTNLDKNQLIKMLNQLGEDDHPGC